MNVQMMVVWQVVVVGVQAWPWWEMGRRLRQQKWLAHVKGIWRVMAKMGDLGAKGRRVWRQKWRGLVGESK